MSASTSTIPGGGDSTGTGANATGVGNCIGAGAGKCSTTALALVGAIPTSLFRWSAIPGAITGAGADAETMRMGPIFLTCSAFVCSGSDAGADADAGTGAGFCPCALATASPPFPVDVLLLGWVKAKGPVTGPVHKGGMRRWCLLFV